VAEGAREENDPREDSDHQSRAHILEVHRSADIRSAAAMAAGFNSSLRASRRLNFEQCATTGHDGPFGVPTHRGKIQRAHSPRRSRAPRPPAAIAALMAVARVQTKASNSAENTRENTGGKNGSRARRNESQLEVSSPAQAHDSPF
jgi:hypothetical protein